MSHHSDGTIDFVGASTPTTKKIGPWKIASEKIREHLDGPTVSNFLESIPRLSKRTKRSKGGQQRQHRTVHKIEQVAEDIECQEKYYYKDWNETEASNVFQNFKVHESHTINIDGFTIFDNHSGSAHESTRHLVVCDKKTGTFLFAKVAPRQCTECLGGKKWWNNIRKMLIKIKRMKPNVGRGDGRSGFNDAYKIYGFRKDPKGKELGKYSFKGNVKSEDKEDNEAEISDLCHKMEDASSRIKNSLKETLEYEEIMELLSLPTLSPDGGHATAFSVGYNYWSKCHVDLDYFITTLSVLSNQSDHHKDILYYFIFPTYKAAIPIRSGEIVLFNPLILHSCSNPRYHDANIFSAYVSTKTVLTQAGSALKEE